jgi:hypothetical protein
MFGFLNSTVLFAALAALIPLIIHLFSRRRVKIVEFSSLKHLKAMQRRQVRRLKVRQLLLLLLRMLIILAVVMAFARPTLKSGGIGAHASVAAVVLIDNSASMSRTVTDGNLFEIARERVGQLLDSFGEGDQVALLTLGRDDRNPSGQLTSVAVAREKLANLQVGHDVADLTGGLERATTLLENASSVNKELYIVSDRQSHGLPEQPLLAESEARVCFVDLPLGEHDNCTVTGLDFGGELILPGHDFELTALVRNQSSLTRDDLIVSLFLDGNRVAQTELQVEPGQEAAARFTRAVSRTGYHSGRVEISDDDLIADNQYYFSFHIPDRFNLLLVKGDLAADLISLALVPSLSINQYWSVKDVAPDNLAGINFFDYDVVILAGAPSLAETYVERLKTFVNRGRSLLITMGGSTDPDFFNSRWADLAGVVIDEPMKTNVSRAGYFALSSYETEHPVFSVFDTEDNTPPEIKFYTLPRVHTTDDARTLMLFSGDRPALVENSFGRGKLLTFTGPIDPALSDLAGHAFFVPFVSRCVEYLTSRLVGFDLDDFTGDRLSRSVVIRGSVSMPLQVLAPDSITNSVPPEENSGALVYRPPVTDLPGIYRTSYLGREVDRFALNVRPVEGDLAAVDIDQLAIALGVEDYQTLADGTQLATIVAEWRFGKELWQLFLWLAVILMVLEMLLARSRNREEEV